MASCHISSRHDNQSGLLTIDVAGVFNFDTIADFRASYEGFDPRPKGVVVDMRRVESIDSAALGMLLNMQRILDLRRDQIRIINSAVDVRRVFDITHFERMFVIE
jgi:anti-anti-sigma factor